MNEWIYDESRQVFEQRVKIKSGGIVTRTIPEEAFLNQKEKQTMNKVKLFEVTGEGIFGTLLATNSKGNYVLEVKGTGECLEVHPDKVEEVRPWTFSVKFGPNSREYHFVGDKGSVKKGDVLLRTNSKVMGASYNDPFLVVVVTATNTKSASATIRFEGCKLSTGKEIS